MPAAGFNRDLFYQTVHLHREAYPEWRYGQTVFNVMRLMHPTAADYYLATGVDPYYNNSAAQMFIDECERFVNNGDRLPND